MNDIVIKVENLSKRYKLGLVGYGTLKDDLRSFWAKVRGKEDPNSQIGKESRFSQHGDFWALRNVSFEVSKGDRVGIIGRNGAGKSTLLKILSRITAPTEGKIKIKGRIASLLEVGTGFHPELTGRENIFLNGAILGMRRSEILRKFDEIVEFAGVSDFIDTPVKRYSSGMYVRLAFSVAAHLESDILVLDEVLAVGDVDFQRKCLGKLESINANDGKTIIFVSHQLHYLRKLCEKAVVMKQGHCLGIKPINEAIDFYTKDVGTTVANAQSFIGDSTFRRGTGHLEIEEASLNNNEGQISNHFTIGDQFNFILKIKFLAEFIEPGISVALRNSIGGEVLTSAFEKMPKIMPGEVWKCRISIKSDNLRPGVYYPYVWAGDLSTRKQFEVLDSVLGPIELTWSSGFYENYDHLIDVGYFSVESSCDFKKLN